MTRFSSRAYRGGEDIRPLYQFASEVVALRGPGHSTWNPGDIAWQLGMFPAGADLADFVRLWEDGDGVAALAIFEPPLNFAFDIHPRLGFDVALAGDVVAWAQERRREAPGAEGDVPVAYQMLGRSTLSTEAGESDVARIRFLRAHGYERVERHSVRYIRTLEDPIAPVTLPAGMRFRHTRDADIEARAELHREAWSVWGPSSFSASRFRRLRAQPVYDETLDVVVEDGDGRLQSYCIAWLNTAAGVGHFEPVGTRPSATAKGLGRAVVMEGLRRLRERGATTALIGTASVNAPALKCYVACGFQLMERAFLYSKTSAPVVG
jgi:ribosomal protein S18 acetylase RimI-like enzyme